MSGQAADYLVLTKPRLTGLVLVTVCVGYFLGAYADARLESAFEPLSLLVMLCTVIGVGLSSGGSGALNQWMERKYDALMHRTRERPLPAGRLSGGQVFFFGIFCCVAGVGLVFLVANTLAALLTALTVLSYLLLYTPMKRRSSFNTLVGAITGAIPPMIGWAAAKGNLSAGAWTLFFIVYIWQLPHFFAIAWFYKEDYERAGMKMLPNVDRYGLLTRANIAMFSMLLVPVSLLPTMVGLAGRSYFYGAIVIGAWQLWLGLRFIRCSEPKDARSIFLASLLYLPLLLTLLVVDTLILGGNT